MIIYERHFYLVWFLSVLSKIKVLHPLYLGSEIN